MEGVLIYIDSSMFASFNRCREEFRQTWLMNRASAFASVHQVFGSAVHDAVEAFWTDTQFSDALNIATNTMRKEESRVHSSDQKKWGELKAMLPTCIATYFDSVEYDEEKLLKINGQIAVEH